MQARLSAEVDKRDKLEQQGRRWQVEISGLKHYEGEPNCCKSVVTKIASLMKKDNQNIVFDVQDVGIAHRTYNKSNIIVQFSSRTARNIFFNARFSLKNIRPEQVSVQYLGKGLDFIFVNEVLSFDRRELMFKVRAFCKTHGVSGVRVEKGFIKIFDKKLNIDTLIKDDGDLVRFRHRFTDQNFKRGPHGY